MSWSIEWKQCACLFNHFEANSYVMVDGLPCYDSNAAGIDLWCFESLPKSIIDYQRNYQIYNLSLICTNAREYTLTRMYAHTSTTDLHIYCNFNNIINCRGFVLAMEGCLTNSCKLQENSETLQNLKIEKDHCKYEKNYIIR